MAKKKKGAKKKSSARRMGAMTLNPNSPLVQFGSVGLGLLINKPVNEAIDKLLDPTKVDQKLVSGGQVGLGGLLVFKKFSKNKTVNIITTIAGGVVAGAGLKRAMTAFGIGGFGDVRTVNGYQDVKAVGGKKSHRQMGNYLGTANPSNGDMGMHGSLLRQTAMGSGIMDNDRLRA